MFFENYLNIQFKLNFYYNIHVSMLYISGITLETSLCINLTRFSGFVKYC